MLWKVKDKNQRAKIIEEAGLDISEEQLFGMLDHCISEPYGFLTIDFQSKVPEHQFRKCFKAFLNPADYYKDIDITDAPPPTKEAIKMKTNSKDVTTQPNDSKPDRTERVPKTSTA